MGSETISLEVVDAELPVGQLLATLIRGDADEAMTTYLDASGNADGSLDLGDVRAYLERTDRWWVN